MLASMPIAAALVLAVSTGLLGVTAIQLLDVARSLEGLEAHAETLRARLADVRLLTD